MTIKSDDSDLRQWLSTTDSHDPFLTWPSTSIDLAFREGNSCIRSARLQPSTWMEILLEINFLMDFWCCADSKNSSELELAEKIVDPIVDEPWKQAQTWMFLIVCCIWTAKHFQISWKQDAGGQISWYCTLHGSHSYVQTLLDSSSKIWITYFWRALCMPQPKLG